MRAFSSRPTGRLKRGYARSTRDQNKDGLQKTRINAAGGPREKTVEETTSVVLDSEIERTKEQTRRLTVLRKS